MKMRSAWDHWKSDSFKGCGNSTSSSISSKSLPVIHSFFGEVYIQALDELQDVKESKNDLHNFLSGFMCSIQLIEVK